MAQIVYVSILTSWHFGSVPMTYTAHLFCPHMQRPQWGNVRCRFQNCMTNPNFWGAAAQASCCMWRWR